MKKPRLIKKTAARSQGAAMVAAGGQPNFNAASVTDPRLSSWIPVSGSADSDLLPELERLRSRTRSTDANSGLGHGAIRTTLDNVIGHQIRISVKPEFRRLGMTAEAAREFAMDVEADFRTWAGTTECDAARQQTLWGLARTAFGGFLLNGDCITIPKWLPRPDSQWSTRLMNIESDRLSTPMDRMSDPFIRGGVKIHPDTSEAISYFIQRVHPGDAMYYSGMTVNPFIWDEVPAFTPWGRRQVIHLFDKERASQNRGIPLFTRVLREFRVSEEYVGHELQAAAVNALFAGFLESDMPPELAAGVFGQDLNSSLNYYKQVSDLYHRKKLEGGVFLNLPFGTKLSSFKSERPNVAFDSFMTNIMRYLAAGLNMPYELFTKDFSKSNYSSARAALLEAWRYFLSMRQLFIENWLQPVYELWFEEAVNIGVINAPSYYQKKYFYLKARWTFAGRGWVDPAKEAQAAQIRKDSKITNAEIECAEQGLDWEEVLHQSLIEEARERQLRLEMNLPEPEQSVVKKAAPVVENNPPEEVK
jgi:lambda family phage portal protein